TKGLSIQSFILKGSPLIWIFPPGCDTIGKRKIWEVTYEGFSFGSLRGQHGFGGSSPPRRSGPPGALQRIGRWRFDAGAFLLPAGQRTHRDACACADPPAVWRFLLFGRGIRRDGGGRESLCGGGCGWNCRGIFAARWESRPFPH